MEVATVPNQLPQFDSHLPIIGKVDLNSPIEWLWWGGLAVDLLFVQGWSKWIIAAGILTARYEFEKRKR